jgi:hypothetical protein
MYNTDLPTRAELPTSRQLLRSTAIAVVAAAGILVTVVLPAEYAIDPTGVGNALGLTEMGEIKAQLAAESEADRQASEALVPATPAQPERRSGLLGTVLAQFLIGSASAQTAPAAARSDETAVVLRPNQGLEVKLRMRKDARATYAWTSTGPVNFDLHGEPPNPPRNFSHSYKSGRATSADQGDLVAAFDGTHGWFWRNRSAQDITVTLRTSGAYEAITRP